MIFRAGWCATVLFYCRDWTYDYSWCANRDRQADVMETPGFASPIRAFRDGLCQMRKSNDVSDTEQTVLDSLGVLDLDLSFGPDAFGLRAFDEEMPKTRMLPGSGPCDLRLLLPDVGLGKMGLEIEARHSGGCDRPPPTLAEGGVSCHARTQCGTGRSAAEGIYERSAGVPLHWAGLLPDV